MLSLIEVGYQSGVPFASCLTLRTGFTEVKAFGDTLGYTGRFQTLIDSIHAKIALDRLAGLRVPLGRAPGTGRNTGFAAHAKFFVYEDNTVGRPFLHRPCWAGCYTPGVLAVEAGHEYIGHAWQVVDFSGADGNYLGQPRSDGQIIFSFAM
jgi:hypothetical protein